MTKSLILIICIVLTLIFSGKAQTSQSHSNVDFLNLNENLFNYWCGPAAWLKDYEFIQFEYQQPKHGWARIIFYPRTLEDKRKIDVLIKAYPNGEWAKRFILKNLNEFNVWAAFVDKKYDKMKEDAGDVTIYTPNYPCKAELFKLDKGKWKFQRAEEIKKKGKEFRLFPQVRY